MINQNTSDFRVRGIAKYCMQYINRTGVFRTIFSDIAQPGKSLKILKNTYGQLLLVSASALDKVCEK